ncbi:hypothetical protein TNCV_566201 [Trichonephila clavipes]|nr:hypothetical protein TNCV_566201 [Trichonephila clavipes]
MRNKIVPSQEESSVIICVCRPEEVADASTLQGMLGAPAVQHLQRSLLNCNRKNFVSQGNHISHETKTSVKKKNLTPFDLRRRLQAPTFHFHHLS